jgi:hypothetical protein
MKGITLTLTDKSARELATQVVKDNRAARVKFGRTNGAPRLHVMVPPESAPECDPTRASFTLRSANDWSTCPLNQRITRNRDMAAAQPTEALMASNGKKR